MFRSKDREECERLLEKYYRDYKFHDALYRDLINKHIQPGHRLLDAGCGRYMKYCKELSGVAQVVGIDLEPVLETNNEHFPFGVRGNLAHLPFPSDYFDVVISRSVVEHLEDPLAVFREFARVLRPGGKIVIVTPNKYDYVSVIAAITPYRFHRFLVSRLFQVPGGDAFPTLYRANTRSALRKIFRGASLTEVELQMVNHYPAYLMFSPLLFRLGILYERLTSLAALAFLRGLILAVFQKPVQTADSEPHVQPTKPAAISVSR